MVHQSCLTQLKANILMLQSVIEKKEWHSLTEPLNLINQDLARLGELPQLAEEDCSPLEWQMYCQLKEEVKALHAHNLKRLQAEQATFYQEVKQVKKGIQASQAYNNMKRL